MIYVISDIHGCLNKFQKLVKKLRLKKDDLLYIIGDSIDYGFDSIGVINEIMSIKQARLLLGDREWMLINGFYKSDFMLDTWLKSGGLNTHKAFIELIKEDKQKFNNIINYIIKSDKYVVIDKFILTHAGLNPFNIKGNNINEIMVNHKSYDMVWPTENNDFLHNKILDNYIVVSGHYPTLLMNSNYKYKKYADVPEKQRRSLSKIWYDKKYNDKIVIDCGCVYGGKLAALRLDDLKEYYV